MSTYGLPDERHRSEGVAWFRSEVHGVRVRLERPSGEPSFWRAGAGVEVTHGVERLALGVVNAYLVGKAGGPWVLVDAGTPGSAERIRAEVQKRFGQGARPEAIVLTHGHS